MMLAAATCRSVGAPAIGPGAATGATGCGGIGDCRGRHWRCHTWRRCASGRGWHRASRRGCWRWCGGRRDRPSRGCLRWRLLRQEAGQLSRPGSARVRRAGLGYGSGDGSLVGTALPPATDPLASNPPPACCLLMPCRIAAAAGDSCGASAAATCCVGCCPRSPVTGPGAPAAGGVASWGGAAEVGSGSFSKPPGGAAGAGGPPSILTGGAFGEAPGGT